MKNTIEVLRQPLEEKSVTIARLNGSYKYPAGFMLVAAMNPCSCGFYPDRSRCNCSVNMVKRYLGRISQPLLDRFDISIEALQINYKELSIQQPQESSEQIRIRVSKARQIQQERYKGTEIYYNSQLSPRRIKKYCHLENKEQRLLEEAFIKKPECQTAYSQIS